MPAFTERVDNGQKTIRLQGAQALRKPLRTDAGLLAAEILALEDEGLILRSMGEKDARMKRITATARAQALNDEAERRIAATEAVLTRGLSPEEIDQFLATAEKLKRNLLREPAARGSEDPGGGLE